MRHRARPLWTMIVLALVVLSLFGRLDASPIQRPVSGGTLTIALGTDALTMDPHNYRATTDVLVDAMIYDTLVRFDDHLRIRPSLALSWLELSATSWRFDLRPGIKFTDGTPLDGHAVKLSLERAAVAPRGSGFLGIIDHVDVVTDSQVVVHLKRPFAPFLQALATPIASIVSPTLLQPNAPDINTHADGTGPFMLDSWIPNQQLRLVRNPGYWGPRPYLDAVVFKPIPDDSTRFLALKGGQADVISNPPTNLVQQIRADPRLTLQVSPSTRDVRVAFTVTNPPFDNVKVRQALAMAINRDPIVKFVLNGLGREANCGLVPPEVMTTSPCADLPYDVAKAKQLLAEAGYPNGLSVEFWTPEGRYLGDRQIAEAVQQQLQQINVRVQVKVWEWGAYLSALARHEGPMFIIGWGWTTGDPAQAMQQNFGSKDASNFANYSNSEFDRMLQEASATDDPTARQHLYSQMESTLLVRDAVAKEIYYTLNIYGANQRVHDFVATPIELIDVSRTWVSAK